MKILRNLFLCIFLLLSLLINASCNTPGGEDPIDPPVPPVVQDVIIIDSKVDTINLDDDKLATYKFENIFVIYVNEEKIDVLKEYIDISQVGTETGDYPVTCTYGEESKTITVHLRKTVYRIDLEVEEVKLKEEEVESYNFYGLFKAYKNDEQVVITKSMITSNVEAKQGNYTYTVTIGGVSKTLNVTVDNSSLIEIYPQVKALSFTQNELNALNFKNLFSLYVDGVVTEISNDNLTIEPYSELAIGETFKVTLSYANEYSRNTEEIVITIVEEDTYVVNTKTIIVYPNCGNIDFTSLFDITYMGNKVNAPIENITGSVNVSVEATYPITLLFNGVEYISYVEVKKGVIINYTHGDTVDIKINTDINTYSFEDDFELIINGIRYHSIPLSMFDLSNVNFDEVGEYKVKLTIPYNEKKLSITSVKFDYYEKEITYNVVDRTYTLSTINDLVIIEDFRTSYDVTSNVNLYVNNIRQKLTTVPEYASRMATYYEVLSEDINFKTHEVQQVKLAIYVFGVDKDPVICTYNVKIDGGYRVETCDKTIYTGETIYPEELFKLFDGDTEIPVTKDMVTGHIDHFTQGVYTINFKYGDASASAKVTVFDSNIKGEYVTDLSYTDDNGSKNVGRLVIENRDNMKIGKQPVTALEGLAIDKLKVQYYTFEFELTYNDGVVFLSPINDHKMSYASILRPYIFFNSEKYDLKGHMQIDYGANYVLYSYSTTYSFDLFAIYNKETQETEYYAMLVNFLDKVGADYYYSQSYERVYLPEDFDINNPTTSTFKYKGVDYNFNGSGKIIREEKQYLYVNKTFTGTYNGKTSKLSTNQYEGFTLTCGMDQIFSYSSYEFNNNPHCGPDYKNNTVLLYQSRDVAESYKFNLDPDNLTFEYIERDKYFGKYEYGNSYIFIDGYGKGVMSVNKSSYAVTEFNYEILNNEMILHFYNQKAQFPYGDTLTFYVHDLLNVLTVKDNDEGYLLGAKFVNTCIQTGAIINVNKYIFDKNSDAVSKEELLKNITYITKDGTLSYDELVALNKAGVIDTSKVKFSKQGFYQFSISCEILGETITTYYAISVLDKVYQENGIAGYYGNSTSSSTNPLTINDSGYITIKCNDELFQGVLRLYDEKYLYGVIHSQSGLTSTVNVEMIRPGFIRLSLSGDIVFSDYYTYGSINKSSDGTNTLFEYSINGSKLYMLQTADSSLQYEVTVDYLNDFTSIKNGAILKLSYVDDEREKVIKFNSWNNEKGFVVSDDYIGSYTKDDTTLVLNGFGLCELNGVSGTYILNGVNATVLVGDDLFVYRLDTYQRVCTKVNVTCDNTLVEHKTYYTEQTYSVDSTLYTAKITIIFRENGVVEIRSESDEGKDYNPVIGSVDGQLGTFSVKQNVITISINGYEIKFEIQNVLTTLNLKVISTNVPSDGAGAIKVNSYIAVVQ